MKTWWLNWRLAVWVAAATVVVFVGLTAHGGWWEKLGVEHMRPFFADTVTTLAGAETWAAGGDPYRDNFKDPYGRPHSYGPWWLWAASVGLERRDAWWLGSLLALGFIVTVVAVAAPRRPRDAALVFLCLVSPPCLLGLERANSDLVIVIMLAAAGWMLGRARSGWAELGGAATLVAAAALKFYPLVAVAALAVRPGPVLRRVVAGLLAGLVFSILFLAQVDHYAKALAEAARPISVFTYGLPLAPMSWRLLGSLQGWILLGALPVLVLGGGWAWRSRWALWELLPAGGGRVAAALAGATAWLLCYVMTTNFPYRALLLFLVLPFWLANKATRWVVWFVLAAFWLQMPKYWLAPAERLAVPAWKRLMAVFTGADQALIAVVSLGLVISLVGWVTRRLRAPVSI